LTSNPPLARPTIGTCADGELRAIIAQTDLVFCNRRGLTLAAGEDDPAAGAKTLLGIGPRCVVVTLGPDGAWAFDPSQSVHVRGHRVPVADTTGAGDCFHAAFLCGYLAGWALERTARFANAAAALSVQQVGARAGYPTETEVEQFLVNGWNG
jgi:sugar/nucleoside kinase (ribokinase family)